MFTKWLKLMNITNDSTSTTSMQTSTADVLNVTSATAPCSPSHHERHSAMRNFMTRADSTNSDSTLLAKTNQSPIMAPFRKKAITSIERTRKLSILLKHQRTLVSL